MAKRIVQSSKEGCYHISIPKSYAETLGLTKGALAHIRLDCPTQALIVTRA